MSIRLIPILAAAASLAGAGLVHAQGYAGPSEPLANDEVVVSPPYAPPGAELRREPVSYEDLDLSTHAGANTLMGRINAAARRVCSPDVTYPDQLADVSDHDRCISQAVDRAVADVDAPSLSDVYRYRYERRGDGY